MAFDISATAEVVRLHLEASELFWRAEIAYPTSPPPEGPYAAVYPISMQVVGTTLTNPIELHTLRIQLYRAPYTLDDSERVLESARIASQVAALLYADFTLGANARNIDLGQYSSGVNVEFTDEDTANTPYHVANITLPIVIDPDTAFTE